MMVLPLIAIVAAIATHPTKYNQQNKIARAANVLRKIAIYSFSIEVIAIVIFVGLLKVGAVSWPE